MSCCSLLVLFRSLAQLSGAARSSSSARARAQRDILSISLYLLSNRQSPPSAALIVLALPAGAGGRNLS
jgi:hypothetical protein